MKHCKKILALVTVFVLITSLTVTTYASTSPYTYTITRTRDYASVSQLSDLVMHFYGTPGDEIEYYFEGETVYFDFNQFDSAYRVGLIDAYHAAGLKDSITIPVNNDPMPILTYDPTGFYWITLYIDKTEGTWNVKYENSIIRNGTFRNSPISYALKLNWNPIEELT